MYTKLEPNHCYFTKSDGHNVHEMQFKNKSDAYFENQNGTHHMKHTQFGTNNRYYENLFKQFQSSTWISVLPAAMMTLGFGLSFAMPPAASIGYFAVGLSGVFVEFMYGSNCVLSKRIENIKKYTAASVCLGLLLCLTAHTK